MTDVPPPPPHPWAPSTYTGPVPSHPAKWTPAILQRIAGMVAEDAAAEAGSLFGPYRVLDPCAGVGGIHALSAIPGVETVGVEIQPEWAAADRRTVVGDSTRLPSEWAGSFAAVASSFTYPNRMTDHHEAKDPCSTCTGTGSVPTLAPGGNFGCAKPTPCSACKGSGLSRRNTYRHRLDEVGAVVAPGSAVVLGWASRTDRRDYQQLHADILWACLRALRPYGRLFLNISNHVADGVEQRVVEWYLELLLRMDRNQGVEPAGGRHRPAPAWALDAVLPIATPRQRMGANGDARAEFEFVLCLHRRF